MLHLRHGLSDVTEYTAQHVVLLLDVVDVLLGADAASLGELEALDEVRVLHVQLLHQLIRACRRLQLQNSAST